MDVFPLFVAASALPGCLAVLYLLLTAAVRQYRRWRRPVVNVRGISIRIAE